MKTANREVLHKTEHSGVVLGIRSAAEVAPAYRDLATHLGAAATVSETAPSGVELALGMVRDLHLGTLVLVAAGGVLVEVILDRAVGLPPVDDSGARRMLKRMRIAPLLSEVRGSPPVDVSSIERAITAFSALLSELGDSLEAVDVNPLICGPNGAVAVDALFLPRLIGSP